MPDPAQMPAPAPAQRPARVALAHDYLLVMRGAERTFAAMTALYPSAPIFTLLYDEQGTGGRFQGRSITTSSLQRLGVGQSGFRRLLPLYPIAARRMHVPDCDVLLSSSSAFAHGIPAPAGAIHLCYCHAPFRYAWYEQERALSETPRILRGLMRLQLRRMRKWDLAASGDVDLYLANSELTRERIRLFYGRDAPIVHPPVETHRFSVRESGEHLLVVSELVRHKRVHVALEAAKRTGTPIKIVGSGPEHEALHRAYPDAEFLGRASDAQIAELFGTARAVIMPAREEFGITAVEAQAAGRPVIAAAEGGALETVLDSETGILATLDDPESFAQAIRDLDSFGFRSERAVANAERFSVEAFQRRIAAQVDEALRSEMTPRSLR
jgi:glycosyltransferase involved in cell wall biosynthesis